MRRVRQVRELLGSLLLTRIDGHNRCGIIMLAEVRNERRVCYNWSSTIRVQDICAPVFVESHFKDGKGGIRSHKKPTLSCSRVPGLSELAF